MSLSAFVRRATGPALLALCLTTVLLISSETAATLALPSVSATPNAKTKPDMKSSSSVMPAASLTQGVRKTVLDNGLTVLTKELHTAPVVSVQVWYRVGSRDEQAGLNGISHLLEHLMFKGTNNRPIQFGRLFSALGSQSNAFTSYDQTAYFGTVERDKLQALLVLEADRMKNALINPEQLRSEKRVVVSELQGYENEPGYRLERAVRRAAFPQEAYGLTIGGTKADVESFTVEQVRDYYRKYYSPSNATLVIVGDFDTEPTLQAVKSAFGQIPSQEKLGTAKPAPAIASTTPKPAATQAPIMLREPGSASLLQAVYPLPNLSHPDVPALQVMDYILTGGRSSRLYQALVESGLASEAGGYAANLLSSGWYSLSVTAAPGKKLNQIDRVLQRSLANLRDKPVSEAELQRAKNQLRASRLLQNRDVTSQAMQLADDQSVAGDYRYSDRLLAAIAQVSAADVQRVAKTYFQPASRTVGFFEPTQLQADAGATGAGTTQTTENLGAGKPVDPAELGRYLPPLETTTSQNSQALPEAITLENGLRILLLPDTSTPTVTLSGHIAAGTEYDSNEKAGLADLTAENVMNGTKTKDALTLAETLEDRGADLAFDTNREGVTIDGDGLATDLPLLVQTLADVVQNASFPADEVKLSRQRALSDLQEQLDDPRSLGRRQFQQAIYPANHPFHSFPTPESLKQITRDDVVQFYRTHYRPDKTVLALVGNFDPAQVRSLLKQQLGTWQAAGQAPKLNFPTVAAPEKPTYLAAPLPGKTQSVTYLGYQGIDRQDPRYYAALVLNEILGGSTLSSRLGTEIRDRQGLTYGIYSYFQAGTSAGPFLISMQTAPEDSQQAIDSTLALLKQMREQGVSASEVAIAKQSLASGYPVELADPEILSEQILLNEVYGLKREELQQFSDKIQAVSIEQVNQAIQELLQPDRLVVLTAGAPAAAAR
ncbi:insulinase family protein [Trichocoleus sp. FACHB-591]|uniref:M16 family metallopeptidase n=1 Tax=Trichocoleus sp. FACHB-591 TaxID=2692872 RepID=UPI001682854A|nr:pitrilysin family protein [Trichocoleus sp. FACHB-591]MBD2097845.1 insulinase family protein [Trichocoleus sp. FACHB-591]